MAYTLTHRRTHKRKCSGANDARTSAQKARRCAVAPPRRRAASRAEKRRPRLCRPLVRGFTLGFKGVPATFRGHRARHAWRQSAPLEFAEACRTMPARQRLVQGGDFGLRCRASITCVSIRGHSVFGGRRTSDLWWGRSQMKLG